jgi:hypothetical protein
MAGRPLRRARRVAETIARTGGDLPNTEGIVGAELAEDAAAVKALLEHHGNALTALRSIAPNVAALPVAEQRAIARRTFAGNRFMATLRTEIDRSRQALLARQVEIGLDSANSDAAVRAIDSLARIGGWYAPTSTRRAAAEPAAENSPRLSVIGELALMQHEPGPAVAMAPDVSAEADSDYGDE